MSRISFNRKRAKLKQVLGIRARLALLAVILVAPLMLERARSLEDARAKQIVQASEEFQRLANHSAETQREVISSVETVLKSAAYIRASAGGVSRACDILRASLPSNLPWIRNVLLVGGDGRVQCSTNNTFVGLDLSDRAYIKKARATREMVFSDFTFVEAIKTAVMLAGLSGLRHQPRFGCGRRRQHQPRLDVQADGQSRRQARHIRSPGRQQRHRAGGSAGPRRHHRKIARQRALDGGDRGQGARIRTRTRARYPSKPVTEPNARSALRGSPAPVRG